ncbi:hypothetical protein ACW9H6_07540 [Pseudomonas sp. SDO528_S397]
MQEKLIKGRSLELPGFDNQSISPPVVDDPAHSGITFKPGVANNPLISHTRRPAIYQRPLYPQSV